MKPTECTISASKTGYNERSLRTARSHIRHFIYYFSQNFWKSWKADITSQVSDFSQSTDTVTTLYEGNTNCEERKSYATQWKLSTFFFFLSVTTKIFTSWPLILFSLSFPLNIQILRSFGDGDWPEIIQGNLHKPGYSTVLNILMHIVLVRILIKLSGR